MEFNPENMTEQEKEVNKDILLWASQQPAEKLQGKLGDKRLIAEAYWKEKLGDTL